MPGATPPPAYSGANPMPTSFNFMGAIKHAIDVTRSPASVMVAYRDADPSLNSLMINYVAVLAAIPFVATLIGDLIIYRYTSLDAAISFGEAFFGFVTNVIGILIIGWVIWKLAPSFSTNTTQIRATRLAAYSYSPFFLISVINIIPFTGLRVLDALGLLYGLYIVYLGLPTLLGTPKQQALTYLIVSVIAVLVVYVVLGVIVGVILGLAFGLAYAAFLM